MAEFNIALIGAGVFAREEHAPALQAIPDTFAIKAVYSRTAASAQALADQVGGDVDVYTDLDALLAREDIHAVDVVLPISAQPDVIRAALKAGKHVISEKPVEANSAQGKALVEEYEANYEGQLVWSIAENYRYQKPYEMIRETIQRGDIGRVWAFDWSLHIQMDDSNRYYHSPWRRSGELMGGFLLDGGVHHIAVMRYLLGDAISATAVTAQQREDLPPADTISASIVFKSGAVASYLATYATGAHFPRAMHIAGEKGSIRLIGSTLEIHTGGEVLTPDTSGGRGIEEELLDFAAAMRGESETRTTPREGLLDVALVEALLLSAERGQTVNPADLLS